MRVAPDHADNMQSLCAENVTHLTSLQVIVHPKDVDRLDVNWTDFVRKNLRTPETVLTRLCPRQCKGSRKSCCSGRVMSYNQTSNTYNAIVTEGVDLRQGSYSIDILSSLQVSDKQRETSGNGSGIYRPPAQEFDPCEWKVSFTVDCAAGYLTGEWGGCVEAASATEKDTELLVYSGIGGIILLALCLLLAFYIRKHQQDLRRFITSFVQHEGMLFVDGALESIDICGDLYSVFFMANFKDKCGHRTLAMVYLVCTIPAIFSSCLVMAKRIQLLRLKKAQREQQKANCY